MRLKTLADLKHHAKSVQDSFFSVANYRYFGSDKSYGIYREPYSAVNEGYIIAETVYTGSNGVSDPAEYRVYRFEATPDTLEWSPPIGKHDSLADAEAFLSAMGAVK